MERITLFKKDSKDKTREWSVEVTEAPDKKSAEFFVRSGVKGGKMIETKRIVYEGKNIGKANETSPYQQAVSEAESDITGKRKGAYVDSVDDMKAHGVKGNGTPAVQLAEKYDPTLKIKGSKNIEKLNVAPDEIVALQFKVDGLRGPILITPTDVLFYTRTGESMFPLPHIVDSLRKRYDAQGMTGEVWLDGELFCDTSVMPFNKLSGFLRGERKTAEEFEMEKSIRYVMYDTFDGVDAPKSNDGYVARYEFINIFIDKTANIEVVHTEFVNFTQENIDAFMERSLNAGYEGTMIRRIAVPYQNKRSWCLMKYKIFQDAEFEVIGFKESKSNHTLGSIQFKITDYIREDKQSFDASFNGTDKECLEIWNNQEKYLGKFATVVYFGVSEYNVPRFPKVKAFRKGKSID